MFDDVYLVSEKLVLISQAELNELQAWLAAPLPRGYREFMTTLGLGTYCDFMQVLAPSRIREAREERQEFVRQYYLDFWGEKEGSPSLDDVVAGVCFASTIDGDEVYYLTDRDRMFVLPRHDDVVFWLEAGFEDPLVWRSSVRRANVYRPPFRYFEPAGEDRRIIEFFTAESFDMLALERQFRAQWSGQEVRSIPGPESAVLFPRVIQGRIQLTQSRGDRRVGVRVDFDSECSAEFERFAAELRAMGFYETWRHPGAEPDTAASAKGL